MKSIKQIVTSIKTYKEQYKVLTKWTDDWECNQKDFYNRIRESLKIGDYEEIMRIVDLMENTEGKRFTALNYIIDVLSDPKRKLRDDTDAEAWIINSIEIEGQITDQTILKPCPCSDIEVQIKQTNRKK